MAGQGQDRKVFGRLIKNLKKKCSTELPGQLILKIGKFFLGTPYLAGTLEVKEVEHLVLILRKFDCVTFVENVVALACCARSQNTSFKTFLVLLRKIRYRQGRLEDYSSRVRYFSDWIHDSQRKGIERAYALFINFVFQKPYVDYQEIRDESVLSILSILLAYLSPAFLGEMIWCFPTGFPMRSWVSS